MVGNPLVAVAEAVCELWEERGISTCIDGASVQTLLEKRDVQLTGFGLMHFLALLERRGGLVWVAVPHTTEEDKVLIVDVDVSRLRCPL